MTQERERVVAALAGRAFTLGQRVQISPATDRLMRGDRYGAVMLVARHFVSVRLDKSGTSLWFRPEDVFPA
jgi:hypothetical protein